MLPKRVFLVEDNLGIRTSVGEALATIANIELVGAAATSAEARQWLSANRYGWDIAVIDIFLAEGHGFDVLRGCLKREPYQKAVVLSNYTKDPVRVSAKSLGADAVFDKSLEMEAFLRFCASISDPSRTTATEPTSEGIGPHAAITTLPGSSPAFPITGSAVPRAGSPPARPSRPAHD